MPTGRDASATNRSQASTANDSQEATDQGVLKQVDYLNLKGLLVEVKEYHKTVDELLLYLKDRQDPEPPAPPAPAKKKQSSKAVDKPAASKDKEDDKEENQKATVRCENLRESIDPKSKLQDYQVLNMSNEYNLCDMLKFLGQYMQFTAEMAHYLFYIGDMVE